MPNKPLSILFAASECFPLIKTGGLADVVGALPLALTAQGAKVTVLLPGYPDVLAGLSGKKTYAKLPKLRGEEARLISGKTFTGLDVIALDAPQFFNVSGNPYQDKDGTDRADNGIKFAVFSQIAAKVAMGEIGRRKFDVLHAHDWQAGLAPAFIHAAGNTTIKSVLTIHNLAFQGLFPSSLMDQIDLPQSYYSREGLEYWDQVSFLKAGIAYANHVTTVSPTYALEIQSDEGGMGFGGMLRARSDDLSGILNGIDLGVWNPADDAAISTPFSASAPEGKAKNKAALQKAMGLRVDPGAPLFTVISRLTTQKGLDLLALMTDFIVARGGQLALLGSGDKAIEGAFLAAAKKHPTEIAVTIGYDEPLAHRLQAGADAIFIPSRFEPCGLTQLCAMRYGTVPIVGRVGGLNDTVIDASPMALESGAATGVQFHPIDAHMLASAISRSFDLYAEMDQWSQMAENCLAQSVGWQRSAGAYLDLYKAL